MSDEAPDRGLGRAAQVTANIRLAGQFLREAIAEPSILDAIPDGAAVVMLPHDDPDLARANFDLGLVLGDRGREVRWRRVGGPLPEAERWSAVDLRDFRFREITPRWQEGLDPRDLVVVYDRDRDVLLIDMAAGRRRGVALPTGPIAALLVDLETQEVFGYVMPDFLTRAVRVAPRLAMLLAAAELRSLTEEESGGLAGPSVEGGEGGSLPRIGPEAAARLVDALAPLIA